MPRSSSIVLICVVAFAAILSSCSPVRFSTENTNTTNSTPVVPAGTGISCSPSLNGSSSAYSMTTTGANPTLAANCTPAGVTYTWSVTRSGSAVTINGLTGASSVPDFAAAGVGTYLITLNATSVGYTSYTSSTPLQVTVTSTAPPPVSTVVCDPKLNGNVTSVTLSATNPTIAANCTPSVGVSYAWTVTRNGTTVTIANLSGSSATPDFLSAGPGTYLISLGATAPNYNPYNSTNPLSVTVPTPPTGTSVDETFNVTTSNNKLDILLVVDDSSSMLADNQRLASRLQGFVNDLSAQGFDWQMCATVTNATRYSSSDPNYYWGLSQNWSGNPNTPKWILKSGTANTNQIFTDTINAIGAGWAGTDDERAIKAAWWHLWNGEPGVAGTSGCYRADAGLAVIVLSDEDERSIGGDQTQAYYQDEKNKPLESDDLPQTYVNYVKQVFGNTKRFSVNSIIVRPQDTTCKASQDAEGSISHYGTKYAELSNLTGGYIGSICDTDYSTNLNYFKSVIVKSQASFPLQCSAPTNMNVTVNPTYTYTSSISNSRIIFTPQVNSGSSVNLKYVCP